MEKNRIKTYLPQIDDLWFREKLLQDKETMSYNTAWGGVVDFPESQWEKWHTHWIKEEKDKRYYRYLVDETNNFIGEVAYYFNEIENKYLTNIIIYSPYRKRGYGREALRLLCQQAKINGLTVLYDSIDINNTGIKLFYECGFIEEYRTEKIIMLKKIL